MDGTIPSTQLVLFLFSRADSTGFLSERFYSIGEKTRSEKTPEDGDR